MKISGKWMPLLLVFAVVGCGGGGGSSSAPAANGSGTLGVFATDSPETENDHVWATVFKVEVLNQAGVAETVFDDSAGQTLDLKTLRDATGQRFSFLSNGTVSSGTHTSARVTIGSTLTLFPTGAAAGQELPIDESLARDAQGHVVLPFNLTAPRNLGAGSDDLVIDFDLANFTQSGGKIKPALKEGGKSGLDDSKRHEAHEARGTVADLSGTAPNFTFHLTNPNHPTLLVATSASTSFFNSDGSPNPALANGEIVEVKGKFDTAASRLNADAVKINVSSSEPEHHVQVEGVPSEIKSTAGTFNVTTHKVHGFTPKHTNVKVVTTAKTVYYSDHGVTLSAADFFVALATATGVNVEGLYDEATNTLTADNARIEKSEDDHNTGHEAEAKGKPTAVVTSAGTFNIDPLTEWEGFVPTGHSVSVVTNSTTVYRDTVGKTIGASDFFKALATATTVHVEGNFANDKLTATSASLSASGDSGGGGDHGGGGHP